MEDNNGNDLVSSRLPYEISVSQKASDFVNKLYGLPPDIFISHASTLEEDEIERAARVFIQNLVDLLKSEAIVGLAAEPKIPKVWVDFIDNNNCRDKQKTEWAYKQAQFGIFIVSPRFILRSLIPKELYDEVAHYKGRPNRLKCTIPIRFGITDEDYNKYAFNAVDYKIPFESKEIIDSFLGDSIGELAKEAYIKIVDFIKGDPI